MTADRYGVFSYYFLSLEDQIGNENIYGTTDDINFTNYGEAVNTEIQIIG